MSRARNPRLRRSLSFRLTVVYTVITLVALGILMTLSYWTFESTLLLAMDEELETDIREMALQYQDSGMEGLLDTLRFEAESSGAENVFLRLMSREGEVSFKLETPRWAGAPIARESLGAIDAGHSYIETIYVQSGAPARVAYGSVGPGLILQIGESAALSFEALRQLRNIFIVGFLASLFLCLAVGGLLSRETLKGVRLITQAARDISAGAWDSRVPLSHRGDEIGELSAAFNHMVEKVQVTLGELRQITDDIAHDLRTPITRMRASCEMIIEQCSDEPETMAVLGSIVEECDGLHSLLTTMLDISQSETGTVPLNLERIDLALIARDICDLFRPAAEDKGVSLEIAAPASVFVHADPAKLKRAIGHIVDNAVKYTAAGGHVRVKCLRIPGLAQLSVEDTGAGIPGSELEKIFMRFYRVDTSRTHAGNGLGLSLSRALCRAHGGDIAVESTLGKGSVFRVTLPLLRDAGSSSALTLLPS